MRFILRLNDWFGKVEGLLLSISLLSMIGLAFLQVIMRNVFNSGLPWADSVVRHLVLWVGFLGAVLATKLEHHLSIDVLTKFMGERLRYISSISVKVFASVICLFLFKASLRYLSDEASTGQQFLDLFASWWTLVIVPITFILIPFHFLIAIIQDLQSLFRGKVKREKK